MISVFDSVENSVGKGENACYLFSPVPAMFLKGFSSALLKSGLCGKGLNSGLCKKELLNKKQKELCPLDIKMIILLALLLLICIPRHRKIVFYRCPSVFSYVCPKRNVKTQHFLITPKLSKAKNSSLVCLCISLMGI